MILFLLGSTQVGATAITSLRIVPIQSEKMFLLSVTAKGEGKVNVQFVDEQARILFSTDLKNKQKFDHKFNLDHLPNGQYKLIIDDELKTTEQPIGIGLGGVEIDPSTRQYLYKPLLKLDRDKQAIDLNWLMAEKGDFHFEIRDEASNILFSDQLTASLAVHKRYDVSAFPKGNYFVTIKGENQVFYKNLYLN